MAESHKNHIGVVLAICLALLAGACGGDDTDATDDPSSASGTQSDTDDAGTDDGIAGSVDDGDLLVARDYLQGVWCDSDGTTITIDGDTATLTDSTGAGIEMAVDLLFIDSPDNDLVSQGDDEFVISVAGDQVTFVRGAC